MESIVELWYLNSIALVMPVLALLAIGYVLYDSRQKEVPAQIWLGIGILSLALSVPAAWTTFNFEETDRQVLQSYLGDRATFTEQFGEDVTRAFESVAQSLGITEQIGVDYRNLELYLYLSLASLVGSLVTLIGYMQVSRNATPATQEMEPTEYQGSYAFEQTGGYPPTQPEMSGMPATDFIPGSTADIPGSGGFPDPTAQMGGHPPTEQIDVSRGATGSSFVGQVGSGASPPKTELLNAVPTTVNAWLVVKEGPRAGKLYHLSPEATTIGRDPSSCDIVLDDSAISRQHAKVRQVKDEKSEKEQFILHDLATANGTKLNGDEVVREVLKDGDEINLGRTTLIFKQVT